VHHARFVCARYLLQQYGWIQDLTLQEVTNCTKLQQKDIHIYQASKKNDKEVTLVTLPAKELSNYYAILQKEMPAKVAITPWHPPAKFCKRCLTKKKMLPSMHEICDLQKRTSTKQAIATIDEEPAASLPPACKKDEAINHPAKGHLYEAKKDSYHL
jgi:hypothetical protein